ncbi:Protease, Ulp1 family [Phaffia rhodozyma]|uniref:Protease, Ulp1 family n=1 Tax=Phaffia rhodozyma TaxID=264483 RepID=A0A0F7SJP8_PHARH|nr:Protease, Ulp1 family [Phaffia rhodozyma]
MPTSDELPSYNTPQGTSSYKRRQLAALSPSNGRVSLSTTFLDPTGPSTLESLSSHLSVRGPSSPTALYRYNKEPRHQATWAQSFSSVWDKLAEIIQPSPSAAHSPPKPSSRSTMESVALSRPSFYPSSASSSSSSMTTKIPASHLRSTSDSSISSTPPTSATSVSFPFSARRLHDSSLHDDIPPTPPRSRPWLGDIQSKPSKLRPGSDLISSGGSTPTRRTVLNGGLTKSNKKKSLGLAGRKLDAGRQLYGDLARLDSTPVGGGSGGGRKAELVRALVRSVLARDEADDKGEYNPVDDASLEALKNLVAENSMRRALGDTSNRDRFISGGIKEQIRRTDPSSQSTYLNFLERLRLNEARSAASRTTDSVPFLPSFEDLKVEDEDSDAKIKARLERADAAKRVQLPKELTPSQTLEVENLLSNKTHTSRCGPEQVRYDDLLRLKPQCWLNDEVINFYGRLIVDAADARREIAREAGTNGKGKGKGKGGQDGWEGYDVHYFNTFFFAKLEELGYVKARLARWTKKINILEKDMILVPINIGNSHWTCAVVNLRHKRIEAYDSMGEGIARRVFRLLRDYLQQESMEKRKVDFDFTGWVDYTNHDITPQQRNGYDCGVFACQIMESCSRGLGHGIWEFSQKSPSLVCFTCAVLTTKDDARDRQSKITQ